MARDGQVLIDALLEPPGLTEGKLFTTELDAIEAWAEAYKLYFADAEANAVPVLAPILETAKAAMAGAMTGLSVTGAAAIQSGITAFWTALAPPASVFTAATLITPPPGLAAISADILLAAPNNVLGKKSAPDALGALVLGDAGPPVNIGIHTLCLTGATATFPGGVVAAIL